MADNVQLATGAGGAVARTKDRAGVETQIVGIDLGIGGATEVLMNGGMPLVPTTAGGCLQKHVVAASGTNAAVVKATGGQLYGVDVFNKSQVPIYVKFYNTASTPTVGTTTVARAFGVQAGVGRHANFTNGIAFGTGIGIAILTDIAETGTTGVAAADCVVDIDYF